MQILAFVFIDESGARGLGRVRRQKFGVPLAVELQPTTFKMTPSIFPLLPGFG